MQSPLYNLLGKQIEQVTLEDPQLAHFLKV